MSSTETAEGLYRSQRLLYRAAEDSNEDKAFMQNQILNDSLLQTMSTLRLKKPCPKRPAEEFIKTLQDAILGVIICLPPKTSSGEENAQPAMDFKPVPIGYLSIFSLHSSSSSHHRSAMVGISLADGFRGQGYGGEAMNWALDWAFQHAGLHRVHLGTFSYNHNAIRMYRKVGFVEEGREREAVYHLRGWHDIVNFSMLEHEWEKLRGIGQAREE